MDTKHNPIREDQANNINPREIGKDHPGKDLKAQEKVDIKESELGRETSQMPADEHIEPRTSQIDEGTKQMRQSDDKELGEPMESDSETAEGKGDAGYNNDQSDADWDSEANKL